MRQSDSWNSSVMVGEAVVQSGRESDTKIQFQSTLWWCV